MARCVNNGISQLGRGMGIGRLGDPDIVFKRKFRWSFELRPRCTGLAIPASFVKLAARPNISIEETQIDFLNETNWIPGKGRWETIQLTYYDIGGSTGDVRNFVTSLYSWLASTYDFTDDSCRWQGSSQRDYSAVGFLYLYDGCGKPMELWTLDNVWPTAIDFGDLDMSSSDTADIQLTLRYSKVQYVNFCPGANISVCCTGC